MSVIINFFLAEWKIRLIETKEALHPFLNM